MSRPLIAGSLILAAGLIAVPAPQALAQSDPATQQIIERLTPPLTRGIRVPGADSADTASPASPAAPAGQAPLASGPIAPPVAPTATPLSGGAPPRRETTAPDGAAAISLAIYFPTGSAMLTPQAEQALLPLARALNAPQLMQFRFRIEGHTDTVGDPRSNQILSERRAATVRAWLIQRWGVAPDRLLAIGFGESQPLVPTPDETPNPNNRRVQVVNLGS